jgi:hypothetical protein
MVGLNLGWPCPSCGKGSTRWVSMIDHQDGTWACEFQTASGVRSIIWHDIEDSAPVVPTPPVQGPPAISHFPHVCPHCKGPAYQGIVPASPVDCQRKCAGSTGHREMPF